MLGRCARRRSQGYFQLFILAVRSTHSVRRSQDRPDDYAQQEVTALEQREAIVSQIKREEQLEDFATDEILAQAAEYEIPKSRQTTSKGSWFQRLSGSSRAT